jgi:outer membrane protein assembly factor BamE (lipoprotein component of BamABCDE complex)
MTRIGTAAMLCIALGGCAIQRAEIAQDARAQMVGMSKEQVLGCMGAPGNKAAEGATEVWGYSSGNGMTVVNANYNRFGGTAVGTSRFCNINVVFASGHVSAVNYTGPTGGLLSAGEQCAYAVNACVRHEG